MLKMLSGHRIVEEKSRVKNRCSLLRSLYEREINGSKTSLNIVRAAYQTVYPNCSIIDVKKPTPYLRRFSPDGRYFIAFSKDLNYVEVYDYLGCSMAVDLMKNFKENCIVGDGNNVIHSQIFNRLFRLKYRIRVTSMRDKLIRTFSLFTENQHALVATTRFGHTYRFNETCYNEFVNSHFLYPLETYTFHLVNLSLGSVIETLTFKSDKIHFDHHPGVYLLNSTLAILSIYQQTIYVYEIVNDRFCLLRKIGQFCHTIDYNNFMDDFINGLKHKLMVFLFKKAEHEAEKVISHKPLMTFYKKFKQYLSLRIWKIQLLDKNHLFIRYAPVEVVVMKILDHNGKKSHFMIYDMATCTVLDAFENISDELLFLFEDYGDYFLNPNFKGFMPCLNANNLQNPYQNIKKIILNGQKPNIKVEENKIILRELPIGAQLYTNSPYLDTSLYDYNNFNRISPQKTPLSMIHPIRFYSRKSKNLIFSLYTGKSTDEKHPYTVEYVFHPTEPFAISIERQTKRFITNFHIHQIFMPE